jgi:hypothetical protein
MPTSDIDDENDEATGHETDDPATTRGAARTNGTTRIKPRDHHARKPGVGSASGDAEAASTPPKADEAPWSDRDAGMMLCEMLAGEHPRSLKAYGKTAWDIVAEVRRSDGPSGQSALLASLPCQDLQGDGSVMPSDALRNAVVDRVHLVGGARGPVDYDIVFMWRSPPRMYGRGKLHLPSPEEIIVLRGANRQQQGFQQPLPPPPQQQPTGYGAPPVYPPQQPPPPPYAEPQGSPWGRRQEQPSHDPEVSNLRSEVAGLSGAVRELMEIVRGDRQRPLPQAPPPPAPPQGFAGPPPAPSPGWPRRARPDDEVLEELEDVRDENQVLREEIHRLRRGVGAAPPPQRVYAPPAPPPQSHVQPQPPRVPDGPNGEVWVEGVGWCVPRSRIDAGVGSASPATPTVPPAPARTAAPPPVATPAAAQTPAAQTVGVGAPGDLFEVAMQRVQQRVLQKVVREVESAVDGVLSGTAGLGADPGEQESAPTEPEKPEDILPFVTAKVEGATLFGQPVHYAADKETGDVSLMGLGFANPVLVEKLTEVAQIGMEAVQKLVSRAGVNAGAPGAAALPAGVAGAPAQQAQAQVVDTIPADAQNAGGPGSFPRV